MGKTTHKAKLTYQEGPWSWIIWECNVPIGAEGEQDLSLCSRAIDKDGGKQPKEGDWNLRGMAFNGAGKWEGKVTV
jgi:sulfite oxidase